MPVPIAVDLSIDWRVLAFTLGVAFVASCVTGLVPALQWMAGAFEKTQADLAKLGPKGKDALEAARKAGLEF